jgi:hypothetical protein
MMEAVSTSETSVNLNVITWHYIPEDSNFILMMEAVRISETSVNFNVITWHNIPEDSKLHTDDGGSTHF